MLLVGVIATNTQETPSLTGNGLTWALVTSANVDANRRLCLFRALGASPSAGAITITYTSSQLSCCWSVVQFENVNTTGTSGSGAIVQSDTDTVTAGTTVTGSLAALEHANNVHAAFVGLDTAASVTVDPQFTELGDDSEVSNAITIESEWALTETSCAPTFASADGAIISVEVKAGT